MSNLAPELVDDLKRAVSKTVGLRVLDEVAGGRVTSGVAEHFRLSVDKRWWWQGLDHLDAMIVDYAERDGLVLLRSLISDDQGRAYLVVTDDEFPPWLVIEGTVAELVAVLGDVQPCEYFMADPRHRWLVFDTHHNSLVAIGQLRRDRVDSGPART